FLEREAILQREQLAKSIEEYKSEKKSDGLSSKLFKAFKFGVHHAKKFMHPPRNQEFTTAYDLKAYFSQAKLPGIEDILKYIQEDASLLPNQMSGNSLFSLLRGSIHDSFGIDLADQRMTVECRA